MVERTVLPWTVGRTGGSTAEARRSGWYNGRFYHGIMAERAVLPTKVDRAGGRTTGSSAEGWQNERFYQGRAQKNHGRNSAMAGGGARVDVHVRKPICSEFIF